MCLGVPGQLIEIHGDDLLFRWGWVAFAGIRQQVSLACLPEAKPGDFVLVHAGMALSIIDAAEAQKILAWVDATDARGEHRTGQAL